MSTSDESSNLESPQLFMESPHSSPSQRVPQLANVRNDLNYETIYVQSNGNQPFLRITEQPQNHFRFRYKSEMIGTHGCLLGKSYATNKTKSHPTVELVNYTNRALIRCRLAQHNTPDEHPHQLLEDDQDRDVSTEVPEQGSYRVGFAGMGIIHTAKKDVPGLLFKKYMSRMKTASPIDTKELRKYCENEAKNINLNIVRLRFSAHDINTDQEICAPVFSEPIHNMKSAATNDLKICRMSRCCGRPRGGDDVYILVEKVNKKNVEVRFYEQGENGQIVWSDKGHFLQSDVHHQYAIVFRTPKYQDQHITSDVKVWVELVRPTDGRTSEPKEFTYKADEVSRKKRKLKDTTSSYSSFSSSDGSIKSLSDLPATIVMVNQNNTLIEKSEVTLNDVTMYAPPNVAHLPQTTGSNNLGDALYEGMVMDPTSIQNTVPMMGQQTHDETMDLQLNSAEYQQLLLDSHMPSEEKRRFFQTDMTEYFKSGEDPNDEYDFNGMNFLQAVLHADSGRKKDVSQQKPQISQPEVFQMYPEKMLSGWSLNENTKNNVANKAKDTTNEYNAFYKYEDGLEVKKLVKELCDLIRHKPELKKPIVKSKLERLFDLRLSNGDTFLHMTLCSNQSQRIQYIVKLIHNMKMTHLLNLKNNRSQTVLHLAIVNNLPHLILIASHLIAKGCNPMLEDNEGNNAIHYAVSYNSCLEPLLEAITKNNVSCDLNAYNNEKQTALHLAAVEDSGGAARALLARGAAAGARDGAGRTPLHLAAYDDRLRAAAPLLDHTPPSDIDAVDGSGNTALQIVCGGNIRENTLKMLKSLLEKKADPMKHDDCNYSAWKLTQDKPLMREIIQKYVSSTPLLGEEDIKSEPEDDFDSAEEGEEDESEGGAGLRDLAPCERELCAELDARGAWRELAARLRHDSLLRWYGSTASPARALLAQLKECDETITSKSLAMILEDMGEMEAANIIRRNINC